MSFSIRSVAVLCLIAIAYVLWGASSCWAQAEMRTWHAASGKFSIEAELADIRDDKVQLKKADGTTTWVELQKLSLADIKFVQESLDQARHALRKKLDGGKDADTDTKGSPIPSKTIPTDEKVEEENTERLPGWEVDVESGNFRSPFSGMREVHLVLGQVSGHDLVFPATPSTWLAIKRIGGGGMNYQVANIRTGKMFDPFKTDGFSSQNALSPDGSIFATIDGFPAKVSLYSTSNGKKIKEFNPTEINTVSKTLFVSPQQLLILGQSQKGVGVLYDTKTGKASKSIDIDAGFATKFAISPNAKILAIPSNRNTVGIFDLKTGKKKSDLALIPAKGTGGLSITDLSFCRDGSELVVLGSSSTSELHAFSMKTGRSTARHVLSDQISSFCSNYSSYIGPPIESFSGNKGWVLYGMAIVDREKGGPIWSDDRNKGERGSPFRVLIDDNKQLGLVGDYSSMRFEVLSLPWSEISKSKETVEKGGTVEDAGLPAVISVKALSAAMIQTTLNPKLFSGERIASRKAAKPRPISIDKTFGLILQTHFASSEIAKCIAVPANYTSDKKSALVIDLDSGKVDRTLDASFATLVHGLSPDARWMATTTGKNNDRVDVFDVRAGKHVVGFRPSSDTGFMSRVQGVGFVGNDLLLTVTGDRQAVVWELPKVKPLYRFSTFGVGFRFPKSDRFFHRNEQGWIVRKASDGKIEGLLEGSKDDPSEFVQSAAILDDESACVALAGMDNNQKLIIWDLLTGKRKKEIAMSSVSSSIWSIGLDAQRRVTVFDTISKKQLQDISIPNAESLAWCNQDQILVKWNRKDASRFADPRTVSSKVYSLVSIVDERILWDYRMPNGAALDGGPQGQIWFTEQSTNGYSMVGFEIPTDETQKKIANAPAPKSLLAKGESLVVDVQVNISGDKLADSLFRDQAVASISQNLKSHGIESSDRAGVKLVVRIDQVIDHGRVGSKVPLKMLASCRLTDISNEVLWQRDKMVGAEKDENEKGVLAEDVRRKEWENVLVWLKQTIEPSTMYEKWYYRGLGESILSSAGEKLIDAKIK